MPHDKSADTLQAEAKSKYLEADAAYFEKTGKHLDINKDNAMRTVRRQAEMYVQFKFYGNGAGTDKPGYSIHNYGLAVDMVMGSHGGEQEKNVIIAMEAAGWERTHLPKERWHFDCTSAAIYKDVAKVRNKLLAPSGFTMQWFKQAKTHHDLKKSYDAGMAKLAPQKIAHKQRVDKLLAGRTGQVELAKEFSAKFDEYLRISKQLDAKAEEFNVVLRGYKEKIAAHNQLLDRMNVNRDRLGTMLDKYRGDNTELDEIRDYHNERVSEANKLVTAYNQSTSSSERARLKAKIDAIRSELAGISPDMEQRQKSLDQQIKKMKPVSDGIKADKAQLTEMKRELAVIKDRLDTLESEISPLETRLDAEKTILREMENRLDTHKTELDRMSEEVTAEGKVLGATEVKLKQKKEQYEEGAVKEEKFLTKIETVIQRFINGDGIERAFEKENAALLAESLPVDESASAMSMETDGDLPESMTAFESIAADMQTRNIEFDEEAEFYPAKRAKYLEIFEIDALDDPFPAEKTKNYQAQCPRGKFSLQEGSLRAVLSLTQSANSPLISRVSVPGAMFAGRNTETVDPQTASSALDLS